MSNYLEQMTSWAESRKGLKNKETLNRVLIYLFGLNDAITGGDFNRWQIQTKLQILIRELESKRENFFTRIKSTAKVNQGEPITSKEAKERARKALSDLADRARLEFQGWDCHTFPKIGLPVDVLTIDLKIHFGCKYRGAKSFILPNGDEISATKIKGWKEVKENDKKIRELESLLSDVLSENDDTGNFFHVSPGLRDKIEERVSTTK